MISSFCALLMFWQTPQLVVEAALCRAMCRDHEAQKQLEELQSRMKDVSLERDKLLLVLCSLCFFWAPCQQKIVCQPAGGAVSLEHARWAWVVGPW